MPSTHVRCALLLPAGRMTVVAIAVVLTGCGGKESATRPRPTSVVISGDTGGWIIPCGCTSGQRGGLPRRGQYVRELRRQRDVVLADVGGASDGATEYNKVRFKAIARGEVRMAISAHNIGAAEARLGAEYLRQVVRDTGLPLISCNVSDAQGNRIGDEIRIVKPTSARFALVGVLSPKFQTAGIRIEAPQQAILNTINKYRTRYDHLIVLAYMPVDELDALTANLPEADAVLGGPTGQNVSPRIEGPTWVAAATNKGKFLVRLDFAIQEEASSPSLRIESGESVAIDESLSDDPQQIENVKTFYAELAKLDLLPQQTPFATSLASPTGSFRVGGSESCRRCHHMDCDSWDDSQHAVAWDSLESTGAHVDAYCQQCHTTGYGMPGGFVSAGRSGDHISVGCESCHGPSALHATDPKRNRTAYFSQARGQCIHCHDRENSPNYDYDTYWPDIRHGVAANTPQGEP